MPADAVPCLHGEYPSTCTQRRREMLTDVVYVHKCARFILTKTAELVHVWLGEKGQRSGLFGIDERADLGPGLRAHQQDHSNRDLYQISLETAISPDGDESSSLDMLRNRASRLHLHKTDGCKVDIGTVK